MKTLTLIFALVFSVAAHSEGTVFMRVTDSGVTFRFLDSTCADTNFFTAIAIEENGRMTTGCYVITDADKTLTVSWPQQGMFQYPLSSLVLTKYGERYFDKKTLNRTNQ